MLLYIIFLSIFVLGIIYKDKIKYVFNISLVAVDFLKKMYFAHKCYLDNNINYFVVRDINKKLFYIPTDNPRKYIGKKVYLIKNGDEIDITQKPGIPYFITASDLGGNKIIIKDLFGKEIKTFTENKIPIF